MYPPGAVAPTNEQTLALFLLLLLNWLLLSRVDKKKITLNYFRFRDGFLMCVCVYSFLSVLLLRSAETKTQNTLAEIANCSPNKTIFTHTHTFLVVWFKFCRCATLWPPQKIYKFPKQNYYGRSTACARARAAKKHLTLIFFCFVFTVKCRKQTRRKAVACRLFWHFFARVYTRSGVSRRRWRRRRRRRYGGVARTEHPRLLVNKYCVVNFYQTNTLGGKINQIKNVQILCFCYGADGDDRRQRLFSFGLFVCCFFFCTMMAAWFLFFTIGQAAGSFDTILLN